MSEPKGDIRGPIEDHIRFIPETPSNIDPDLAKRLDALEGLIESYGKKNELISTVSDYVQHLRRDVIISRRIRIFAVAFASIFISIIFGFLICIMIFHQIFFLVLGTYDRAALIVSSIVACVIILTIMLKGAFSGSALSDGEDLVPEHVKAIIDIAKDHFPKLGG